MLGTAVNVAYPVGDVLLLLLIVTGISVLPALSYGPAALAALADLSQTIPRATTMAIYSLVISLGMLVGILAATQLYDRFGIPGLDAYFGSVAGGLLLLTLVRYRDVRMGRLRGPV
jgi:MFS family permease